MSTTSLSIVLRHKIDVAHIWQTGRFTMRFPVLKGRKYIGPLVESSRYTNRPSRYHDGDTVRFGSIELQVAHCPGHTPGHVVFFHPESRLAIVGDVLFAGSIGRTDFPRGNHAQLIEAIRTKLWPMGDDVSFVPGHGPMSTFGEERQTNPYVADR